MVKFSTITKKGQATIPSKIRKKWGIKAGEKVSFIDKGDWVEVKPATDFLSLRGSVSKKNYSDKEADKAVAEHLKRSHEEKIN